MRQAYERQYGPAPPGARFGADVSWWQASQNDAPSYQQALNCWRDRLVSWAEFVCVRVSTGSSGVDSTWPLHMQAADQVGYKGTRGAYHFAYPSYNRDPAGEAANFARQFTRYPFDFAMLDMEDAAGFDVTAWARQWIDAVNAQVTRPLTLYTAQWYTAGNMAGTAVAHVPLWVAHYAKGGVVDPGTGYYNVPRLPAWSTPPPAIWQFDSDTPELGSLDLNVAFDPAAVALDAGLAPADTSPPEEDMALTVLQPVERPGLYEGKQVLDWVHVPAHGETLGGGWVRRVTLFVVPVEPGQTSVGWLPIDIYLTGPAGSMATQGFKEPRTVPAWGATYQPSVDGRLSVAFDPGTPMLAWVEVEATHVG